MDLDSVLHFLKNRPSLQLILASTKMAALMGLVPPLSVMAKAIKAITRMVNRVELVNLPGKTVKVTLENGVMAKFMAEAS